MLRPLCRVPHAPEYHLGGELAAESTGGQISSRLLSMRTANALLELPSAEGTLSAGTLVSALLIADLGSMPVLEQVQETPLPVGSQWGL